MGIGAGYRAHWSAVLPTSWKATSTSRFARVSRAAGALSGTRAETETHVLIASFRFGVASEQMSR